jgi:hypothetical protein
MFKNTLPKMATGSDYQTAGFLSLRPIGQQKSWADRCWLFFDHELTDFFVQ